MKHHLKLVHPASLSQPADIQALLSINNTHFVAEFEVNTPLMHVNDQFSTQGSQQGLWDWDVVEVFLASRKADGKFDSYFEFQVSPLNQFFELEIFEPRKKFNAKYSSQFAHDSHIISADPANWVATMEIPLAAIGHKPGNTLVGNLFACLNTPEKREYYSLFLPKQNKPDFHLPEFFKEF